MGARRLISAAVASLCSLTGGLMILSSAALAAPPQVTEESVLNLAATSAVLTAQINPEGSETTYRFEYGMSTLYGESLPVPDGLVGSGSSTLPVSAHPQDLQPSTTYHFRVIVTAVGTHEVVDGPDQTFTTQSAGGELALLDGRAWELVSPTNKNGALIELLEEGETVAQASENGGSITYLVSSPIGQGVKGDPGATQVLSTRSPEGWSSRDLESPHTKPTSLSETGDIFEDRFFSSDLSLVALDPNESKGEERLLSPEATEPTVYIRNNSDGTYHPLVTPENVPLDTKFGENGTEHREMRFVDATPDLSHVILSSPEALTANAKRVANTESEGVDRNLYEWTDGQLQLVNVLPSQESTEGNAYLGRDGEIVAHAVSTDGRRVIWSDGSRTESAESPISLYMRDMVTGVTVRLGGPHALFQTMSSDGSKIFFNETEEGLVGDLMEYDANTGLQTDLTVPLNPGESAGVQPGLMGASEDGSYVYFVATGVLAPGGTSGADNLYLLHDTDAGWQTTFVAGLSKEDERSWVNTSEKFGGWSLSVVSSRISPDGRYLAFMSERSLTGYDNLDALSGQPDEEVYLYDSATGRLVCASCDPTGARPVGVLDTSEEEHSLLVDRPSAWAQRNGTGNHWLAGSIPGWAPGIHGETGFYQPRYLSDSGRLFFDSSIGLVPQDTNGLEDVYEYEPLSIGSCASSTPTFGERSGGCVDLISSGTTSEESAFYDASVSGDDAFFVTIGKLTSQDVDTSYDVYDAHACSASSPCSSVPLAPPACTTVDSCKSAPSPQPAIFGAPASATFSGTGNVVPTLAKKVVKTSKHKTKTKRRKKRKARSRKKPKKASKRNKPLNKTRRNKGAKRS